MWDDKPKEETVVVLEETPEPQPEPVVEEPPVEEVPYVEAHCLPSGGGLVLAGAEVAPVPQVGDVIVTPGAGALVFGGGSGPEEVVPVPQPEPQYLTHTLGSGVARTSSFVVKE